MLQCSCANYLYAFQSFRNTDLIWVPGKSIIRIDLTIMNLNGENSSVQLGNKNVLHNNYKNGTSITHMNTVNVNHTSLQYGFVICTH